MKVCILTHTFPRHKEDGTAAFMHSLVMGLRKAKTEVVVLTPYTPGFKKNSFDYKIISYPYIWPARLHTLGYSNTLKEGMKLPIRAYILAPSLILAGIINLYKLCKKEKIDIISAHWILPNGFIAFIVSKLLNIPYVVTLPGSDVFVAKKNWLFSLLALLAANSASAVVADSPKFLETLLSLHPKIMSSEIIPYPVDADVFKPIRSLGVALRQKLNFISNNIIILAVGRLVNKKGFQYLIQAMQQIIDKNKNVRLVIVGDGDLRNNLENLVSKLRLTEYVLFVGNIERRKLLSYYNMADIFNMSSVKDEEGNIDDQPVSLIEAMACGKPIVATNFPGISITVSNGKNGFLVPEKNVKMIEVALTNLIISKELRLKMGKESRKIAVNKLSIGKIGEKYDAIFQKVKREYVV